jgi:acetylornithine deacetylase
LLLGAHVDVVPPGDLEAWTLADPFEAAVRGDRIVGRGACDMKGGVVAALLALRALRTVPLRGDVLLACVEGEEDGGAGMFATLRRGWRADACVIPEPTGLDVVPAAAGALTFRLRVRGAATHASRRTAGVSAVDKFLPVFAALRDLERRRSADADPLMRRWDVPYPLEVGTVVAGDWPSSVPDLLVAEGRFGVALDEPVTAARAEFEAAVARACEADPWLRDHPVEVEWWGGQFASGRTPVDHAVVSTVRRAHATVTGDPPGTWGGPYGSDLRLLVDAGVPTVHYGPGDVSLAHGPDESVPVTEVVTAARALAVAAVEFCGVG